MYLKLTIDWMGFLQSAAFAGHPIWTSFVKLSRSRYYFHTKAQEKLLVCKAFLPWQVQHHHAPIRVLVSHHSAPFTEHLPVAADRTLQTRRSCFKSD